MKPQHKVVPFAQNVNDELYVISQDLAQFSLEEYEDVIMSNGDRFFDQRQIIKVVIIPQDTFKQPAKGDVLAGLVLPMVGGGYFSVVDLLIIPDKIRAPLISKLIRFYESDITVSTNEFFSRDYPVMLRKTIKHLIENKIKNKVKVYR